MDNNFAERLSVSPFYPFAESGHLCPYLDDADRLFQLLQLSTHRQTFKKFCKAKDWAGKPSIPPVMTDEALKALLLSACNSADARRAMAAFEGCISLHRIIYDSVSAQNHTLHEACSERLDKLKRKAGKNCITPEMLREVIVDHVEDGQYHEALHRLALSLAILNQEQAVDYIVALLHYFPDSVALMGPLDEGPVEYPVKSKSYDNNFIDNLPFSEVGGFSCSLTNTSELARQLNVMKSALDEFRKASNQIVSAIDLKDFSDAGPIETQVKTLTRTRQLIEKSGGEITEILGAECQGLDGLECAFMQELREFNRPPPEQVAPLIAVTTRAVEVATSVENLGKSARAILPSLESQAREYLRQLGCTDDEDFGTAALKFPCESLRAKLFMQRRVNQLKDELDTRLATVRAELEVRLDALAQTVSSFTASDQSLFNEKIAEIRRRLCVVKDMQEFDECCSQVQSLEEMQCDTSSRSDLKIMTEALSQLQSNRANTLAVLELCEVLLDLGLNDIALLTLLTRQHVYSAEEIVAEPDRAVGALVEAVCRIGDAQGSFTHIWHSVCDAPWLLAIGRNDLISTDLIERLAVMYVAEAISGCMEKSANGLLSLGMSDRTDLSLPPSIDAIVEALVFHKTFRVVTASAGSRIDEKRKGIEERIAFDNGKYRHIQCSKATHFARFEAIKVFPELDLFWKKVSSAVADRRLDEASRIVLSADPDEWIEQMIKSHDRNLHPHPHFSAKIHSFVASFVELVRDYIDECGGLGQDVDIVIDEQSLRQELEKWAGNNTARQRVKRCFPMQALGGKIKPGYYDPFEILLSSREVISSCPSAVAWSLSQRAIQPSQDLETCIIEDLGQTRSQDEINDLLQPRLGWRHLKILWDENDHDHGLDYARKEEAERLVLSNFRPKIIEYSKGSLVEVFDACCKAGRFKAARGIMDECEKHLAEELALRMKGAAIRVDQALDELDYLKEQAEDKGMSSEWVDAIYKQSSEIERPLKKAQRAIYKGEQIDYSRISQLENVLRAFKVVVGERSNSLDAVKFLLEGETLDSIASRRQEVTEQDAHARCPELVDAWLTLRSRGEDKAHAAWVAFAKLFGKLCNLYHDESDPNGRFVPVTPFNYPHSIYQTAFYKPKSEFLKRPLRFYLYRDDVDNQARQRLDAELSEQQSAAWLHLIFAPSGADKLRKSFQLDKKFRGVLVIDNAFLYRICVEEKHDVPVRRGLHGIVADLVSSSPFVANGYCHQENNIYVGRTEVIQRLLNHPQAMIWGGRRIGKTSVLHVLESTLVRRHYQVALVYADVHDSVDPDLAIAQRLTVALRLSPVNSVSEFVRRIQTEQKNGTKFAFLLDEVDEYIKKSRQAHNGEFPLASGLRQIVMEDPSKSTVLVYSGYHQLYFEAKLDKSKKRVGHPFVNIASDFPIRDLSHDEVIELVKTGFEEMLGIDLHPDVPSLIAEKASCHPAFVQEFCRSLLGHVSRRRPHPQSKIIISAKDVDDVYRADGHGDGGEQPFIFYVDETLGYNLSDLGRAIMLTIATAEYYSRNKIYDNLCEYADAAEVERPREDHFSDTIDLLVMTNLLTQDANRNDYYRMTYPTFIEILGRLNKLGKTEIEKSLKSYDHNERYTGVLR